MSGTMILLTSPTLWMFIFAIFVAKWTNHLSRNSSIPCVVWDTGFPSKMMKVNSLRLRFALWVSGFLFASLILFGVYVYVSMSRNLNAAVDDALRLSATHSMGTLNVENGRIILADNLPENN